MYDISRLKLVTIYTHGTL